jgi:hypothetical protein
MINQYQDGLAKYTETLARQWAQDEGLPGF